MRRDEEGGQRSLPGHGPVSLRLRRQEGVVAFAALRDAAALLPILRHLLAAAVAELDGSAAAAGEQRRPAGVLGARQARYSRRRAAPLWRAASYIFRKYFLPKYLLNM